MVEVAAACTVVEDVAFADAGEAAEVGAVQIADIAVAGMDVVGDLPRHSDCI